MRWFVQSDLILDFCLEWLNCGRMETDPSSASWYGFRSIPCFVVCWCWSRSMVQGVGFNCPPLQHVRPCCYTTGITADYHRVEKKSRRGAARCIYARMLSRVVAVDCQEGLLCGLQGAARVFLLPKSARLCFWYVPGRS